MEKWFTSDLHLGHANIIGYTKRPFESVEEMNEGLIERWNSVVGPSDQVWVVGDFAMGRLGETLPLAKRLSGHKHLIYGNHDRMFGLSGEKLDNAARRYLDAGFEGVNRAAVHFLHNGKKVVVNHFPYEEDSRHGERYEDERPHDAGAYLIHGHTHGLWRKRGRMIDVGVDAWAGYPVSVDTLADLFTFGGDSEALTW